MRKNEDIDFRSEFKVLNEMGIEPYLIDYLRQQKAKTEIAKKYD